MEQLSTWEMKYFYCTSKPYKHSNYIILCFCNNLPSERRLKHTRNIANLERGIATLTTAIVTTYPHDNAYFARNHVLNIVCARDIDFDVPVTACPGGPDFESRHYLVISQSVHQCFYSKRGCDFATIIF